MNKEMCIKVGKWNNFAMEILLFLKRYYYLKLSPVLLPVFFFKFRFSPKRSFISCIALKFSFILLYYSALKFGTETT